MEIQKCEYLEIEKSFLDEIKSIFCNYLRAIIWWKNWKIADTIIKGYICYIFASLFCISKTERFQNTKALFVLEIIRF